VAGLLKEAGTGKVFMAGEFSRVGSFTCSSFMVGK
jgi:hypothetical protein